MIEYILLALLVIFSVIDWQYRAIPSIFLTGVLFVILALNPSHLFFGILSLAFALLLYEFDYIGGIADIKVIIIIGLMLGTMQSLGFYMILVVIFGFVWKLLIKWRYRRARQTAFIPVFLFVYLALLLLGMI